MAAIVTGLIPILRSAVDATTTYKGRTVWFGFLCIRLVTLFVAQMPWFKLESDFSCNTTSDSICTKACFNHHFDKPVVMAWNYIFVLLVLSVLLMELFTAHVHSVFQKKHSKEKSGVEVESLGELKSAYVPDTPTKVILDMHRSRNAVLFYLFSVMLRILVELWFVYVLLYWNLPKLKQNVFPCKITGSVKECESYVCLVRYKAEKCMSIYALASISILVIIISCMFCAYFIGHYLCNCCTKRPQNEEIHSFQSRV